MSRPHASPPGAPSDPDASLDLSPAPLESTTEPNAPEPWGWTRTHRLALAMLLVLLLVFLLIQYVRHPARLDDPIVVHDGQVLSLETAVDPNTADLPSLLRLPHMTRPLAEAIIEYRESQRTAPNQIVFQNFEDLAQVKLGRSRIPKKTLETLRSFLTFPGDTTQPSPHGLTPFRPIPATEPAEEDE